MEILINYNIVKIYVVYVSMWKQVKYSKVTTNHTKSLQDKFIVKLSGSTIAKCDDIFETYTSCHVEFPLKENNENCYIHDISFQLDSAFTNSYYVIS